MVCVLLAPAAMDPQLTVVIALVHPASEYTPMFGVVAIVPDEVRSWFTVIAARVDATSEKAATVKTTIIHLEVFTSAIMVPQLLNQNDILRLNKHYLLKALTVDLYSKNT
jgi:hypothetical protein